MVLEPLRALLASVVVVAGAPGWFWVSLLAGNASRAEQLVFSMGPSPALAPER